MQTEGTKHLPPADVLWQRPPETAAAATQTLLQDNTAVHSAAVTAAALSTQLHPSAGGLPLFLDVDALTLQHCQQRLRALQNLEVCCLRLLHTQHSTSQHVSTSAQNIRTIPKQANAVVRLLRSSSPLPACVALTPGSCNPAHPTPTTSTL